MTTYPNVLGEVETMRAVVAGRSLARYGDGEFKLCQGFGIKSQVFDASLQGRLRGILRASGQCLVGIPNIHSATPKAVFWRKFLDRVDLLVDRPYASAFVTRPDSAPWINTPDYWRLVESLWVGQDVTLVRGSQKSLAPDDLVGARSVRDITTLRQHAWQDYASILARIGRPRRAILCLGPTATVAAVDLAAHGVHAIDLGHIALFLRKMRRGEPMTVTDADKAVA